MSKLSDSLKELQIPRYKNAIEEMQCISLAPYATKIPRRNSRRFEEPDINFQSRSDFQRDRDRIIHSKAFRRLMYKTQVFVNHEGDHFRTRMTHSLEVSQISRGIARSLGVNEDLVEAIAIGHDLGHTPFGHAVESLLSDYLKDEYGFYHNEQSVRIVDCIETKPGLSNNYGLNLTWEVREGILKHNHDRTTGIYKSLEPEKPSSIEGQIVALSDTVAYVCHDLEDGIKAGLVDDLISSEIISKKEMESLWDTFDVKYENGVSSIINKLVADIVNSTCDLILNKEIDSIEKVRNFNDKHFSNNIVRLTKYQAAFKRLKSFVYEHIYASPMTSIMDVKATRFIKEIYETYLENPKQLPSNIYKNFIDAADSEKISQSEHIHSIYDGYKTTPQRVLCDYIASMTDRFALETYDILFNPHMKI